MDSVPREGMPEATFKERGLGDSGAAPLLRKALASFLEKSYPKAIEQLREIISSFPTDDAAQYAYFLMGDCYSRMAGEKGGELLRESVSAYLRGVRSYPLSDEAPRGLYQAGRGLFSQGFYYEAIAQLDRISAYYPKSSLVQKSLLGKGVIYFYQKKYAMAESVLRRVVSGNSEDEDKGLSTLWLADTLHMEGRYEEARDLYKKVERSWPEYLKKSRLSILLMGETLIMSGDYEEGRGLFEQYMRLYPESPAVPSAMLRMADSFRSQGRKADSFKLYSRLVSLYPASDAAVMGKARVVEIEVENGKTDSAAPVLKEILSLKGRAARDAALIIADSLSKGGLPLDASAAYEKIIGQYNDSGSGALRGKLSDSLRGAARGCYENKDYLCVLRIYHEKSRFLKGVREPEFLKMIGGSYLGIGLPSEAVSIYEELLSRESKGAIREEILFSAAEAYLQSGRNKDAEGAINRLRMEFPKTRFKEGIRVMAEKIKGAERGDNSGSGYISMADRYLEEKRFKEAADCYGRVIALKEPLLLAAAYIGLGDSYFGMGRYKEAISAYGTGKAAGGEKGLWAVYRIGESYLLLGDAENARAAFREVAGGDKGVYGKMAAEELRSVDMKMRNPKRVEQ